MFRHFIHDLLDIFFPFASADSYFIHQVIIYLRLQIFQGKVIQFYLYFGNAQALCDGRIDFHGLSGNLLLLCRRLVFQGPHIMKAVRQLYHDNPDILGHGQEHFTQVFRLHFLLICGLVFPVSLIAGEINLLQLGDAVYQQRHIRPEFFFDFRLCHDGIFHHIMKEPGLNRFFIQFQIRKDNRNT